MHSNTLAVESIAGIQEAFLFLRLFMNFTKDKIDLDKIRSELVRLEDSIIFALIERFQN